MSNPFATQRDNYTHTVGAEVLLFNTNNRRALRLEAESIGLEFTDNVYIGSGELARTFTPESSSTPRRLLMFLPIISADPEGILSYNDLKVFHKDDSSKPANYRIDTLTYKNNPVLHVKFYHDDINRPFAEVGALLFFALKQSY